MRIALVGARPLTVPHPPEIRLQNSQWQCVVYENGSVTSNRTPPHRQLPWSGSDLSTRPRPSSRAWSRRSRRYMPAYAPSTSRWSYVSVRFMIGRIAITSFPSSSWTTHGRFTSA